MAMSITDVNNGTVYIVDKNDVAAFYELTEYRIVRMANGTEYDVSETFATLVSDVGGGGAPP